MLLRFMPSIIFILNYIFLIGICFFVLFFNIEPYKSLYIQHTGIFLPVLNYQQINTLLMIFIGGPLLFLLGYGLITFLCKRLTFSVKKDINLSFKQVQTIFYAIIIIIITKLFSQSNLLKFDLFTNYDAWIQARYVVFNKLSFFNFTAIYRILPLLVALCLILPKKTRLENFFLIISLLFTIFIQIIIFQKIPVILTILLCIMAYTLIQVFNNQYIHMLRIYFLIIVFTSISVFFYICIMIFMTSNSSTFQDYISEIKNEFIIQSSENMSESKQVTKKDIVTKKIVADDKEQLEAIIVEKLRQKEIAPGVFYKPELELSNLKYSILSLFSRFGAVLFHYVDIFPSKHDFYHFDFGQDIIGMGEMPDDGQVVWNKIYPDKTGSLAVPANFSFFVQGGIFTSFISMFILGGLVSFVWQLLINGKNLLLFRVLMGATVLLFSLQLAMDSARNLIICSYGYFWSFLFLLFLLGLSNLKFFQKNDICLDGVKS